MTKEDKLLVVLEDMEARYHRLSMSSNFYQGESYHYKAMLIHYIIELIKDENKLNEEYIEIEK